jgi:hypothetical protein
MAWPSVTKSAALGLSGALAAAPGVPEFREKLKTVKSRRVKRAKVLMAGLL